MKRYLVIGKTGPHVIEVRCAAYIDHLRHNQGYTVLEIPT